MKTAKGALVATVYADSPAEKAGLRPGDFIHSYGNTPLPDCRSKEDLPVFNGRVLNSAIGAEITLTGERDGKPLSWTLTTVARHPNVGRESEFVHWGFNARDLTPMAARKLRRSDDDGVQVQSVRAGGSAAKARPPLQANDVIIRVAKSTVADLDAFRSLSHQLTADLEKPTPILITFERGTAREQLVTLVEVGPEPKPKKPATADKGWLGAATQLLTPDLIANLELPVNNGLRVTRTAAGSPAATAGLAAGDVLVTFDGQKIIGKRDTDLTRFRDLIAAYEPGTEVTVSVLKLGAEKPSDIALTLTARPQDEDDASEHEDPFFELTVRDLTTAWRDARALPSDLQAVRVTDVTANGWASLAGIRRNDIVLAVNGTPVPDAGAFATAITTLSREKSPVATFHVQRGIQQHFLEIEPTW